MSTTLPQPPAQVPTTPARPNGLAVAGFVVGLVSLALCLIPIVNNLVFVTALAGLLLAIAGVVKARQGASHKSLAIAGIILSVLAGIGVIASQAFYASMLDEVSDALDDTPTAVENLDENPADDTGTEDDSTDTEEPAPDTGSEPGTRENPYSFADTVSNDDWTVTLGEPYEAWDEIHAENEFNEPPADGMEYWIVPVEATYNGSETGLPWIDLSIAFVGIDNVTYSDGCGVVPDSLDDVDELYADGTGKGNACVSVPTEAEGTWTLTAGMFSDPAFFTAEG